MLGDAIAISVPGGGDKRRVAFDCQKEGRAKTLGRQHEFRLARTVTQVSFKLVLFWAHRGGVHDGHFWYP